MLFLGKLGKDGDTMGDYKKFLNPATFSTKSALIDFTLVAVAQDQNKSLAEEGSDRQGACDVEFVKV